MMWGFDKIKVKRFIFIFVCYLGGRRGHDALSKAVGDLPGEVVLSVRLLIVPVHLAGKIKPDGLFLSLH